MAFEDGATLTVKGEGGDVFQMDVPTSGTFRREIFEDFVAKGWLTILDDAPAEPEPAPKPSAAKKAAAKPASEPTEE